MQEKSQTGQNRSKTRQIKFYCTEKQFGQFQALKERHNSSTQKLMSEALEALFSEYEIHEDIEQDMKEERALNMGIIPARTYHFLLRKGEFQWMSVWHTCLVELPDATLFALRQIMEDTLKFFRSSRLKPKPQYEEMPPYGKEESQW